MGGLVPLPAIPWRIGVSPRPFQLFAWKGEAKCAHWLWHPIRLSFPTNDVPSHIRLTAFEP